MLPETMPGDCLLSASKTWLSKAIRFFEKLQTGSADRSHVAICLDHEMIIEALGRVRISDLTKYEAQDIEIWRLPLEESDREALDHELMKLAGDSYGWFKLPLFAMDSIATVIRRPFTKKPCFWFTDKLGITSFKVCSHLYVYALHKFTSYRLRDFKGDEIDWRCVSPDYLQDLFQIPHNQACLIHKQTAS